MKRLKIGLLARIIIAITLGIGFGNVLPGELVRVFVTFNGISVSYTHLYMWHIHAPKPQKVWQE